MGADDEDRPYLVEALNGSPGWLREVLENYEVRTGAGGPGGMTALICGRDHNGAGPHVMISATVTVGEGVTQNGVTVGWLLEDLLHHEYEAHPTDGPAPPLRLPGATRTMLDRVDEEITEEVVAAFRENFGWITPPPGMFERQKGDGQPPAGGGDPPTTG